MQYLTLVGFLLIFTTACHIYPRATSDSSSSTLDHQTINANTVDGDKVVFSGLVLDKDWGDSLIFCSVAIYQEEQLIAGAETNFSGYFSTEFEQLLDTVEYTFVANYVGMHAIRLTDIRLAKGDSCYLEVSLAEKHNGTVNLLPYSRIPLIEQDNTTSGQIFTSEQIRNSPTRGH